MTCNCCFCGATVLLVMLEALPVVLANKEAKEDGKALACAEEVGLPFVVEDGCTLEVELFLALCLSKSSTGEATAAAANREVKATWNFIVNNI